MPSGKRDPVQAALQSLAEAARHPHDPRALATLARAALAHRSNHVVARAARAAREADLSVLAPELIAAFPRFLDDPVRCDPGCVAKSEIVEALLAFLSPAPDVYLRGARHVQREPAFGEPLDTAAALRGTSALALVATEHPEALTVCIELLVDREPVARAGALRALGASARPDITLAVRLFVLRGETDPDVLAEAFAALLALAPAESIPFVSRHLDAPDEDAARAAALALGAARRADAVSSLRERLPHEDRPAVRHTLFLALATSRQDEAFDLLLDAVARGSSADSRAALDALRLYPDDETLQRRVREATSRRRPPASAGNGRTRKGM